MMRFSWIGSGVAIRFHAGEVSLQRDINDDAGLHIGHEQETGRLVEIEIRGGLQALDEESGILPARIQLPHLALSPAGDENLAGLCAFDAIGAAETVFKVSSLPFRACRRFP